MYTQIVVYSIHYIYSYRERGGYGYNYDCVSLYTVVIVIHQWILHSLTKKINLRKRIRYTPKLPPTTLLFWHTPFVLLSVVWESQVCVQCLYRKRRDIQ